LQQLQSLTPAADLRGILADAALAVGPDMVAEREQGPTPAEAIQALLTRQGDDALSGETYDALLPGRPVR
jgi:hypothetical protein